MDPTGGHMGERKTISKISERFMWNGIVKDVKNMVSTDTAIAIAIALSATSS